MSEQSEKIHNLIWRDLPESFSTKKPHIAHYTSLQTLESILRNNEIWFSHPFAMNDHQELSHGLLLGRQMLHQSNKLNNWFFKGTESESHAKTAYINFLKLFDVLFKEYEKDHIHNTFIACFSEIEEKDRDGLLSMWRGYGDQGKGAAFILDTSKISPIQNSPIVLSKVEYITDLERKQAISSSIDSLIELLDSIEFHKNNILHLAYEWFEWLKVHSLINKHKGFKEEKEWRFIYMPERDKRNLLTPYIDYHFINGNPEPKLKLPIKHISGITDVNASLETYIDRLILGPSPENTGILNKNTVLRILDSTGYAHLQNEAYLSSIPFRYN